MITYLYIDMHGFGGLNLHKEIITQHGFELAYTNLAFEFYHHEDHVFNKSKQSKV